MEVVIPNQQIIKLQVTRQLHLNLALRKLSFNKWPNLQLKAYSVGVGTTGKLPTKQPQISRYNKINPQTLDKVQEGKFRVNPLLYNRMYQEKSQAE